MTTIVAGVIGFTGVVLLLTVLLIAARAVLSDGDAVQITINDRPDRALDAPTGSSLLNVLNDHGIFIPSACGGRGTCGACKVTVGDGGGAILPMEQSHISRPEATAGVRLACQLSVKRDLSIELPPEVFSVHAATCRVRSTHSVSTFIKELILEVPEGESFEAVAGSYIQIEAPPHRLDFADIDVDPQYQDRWQQDDLHDLHAESDRPQTRAYSLGNHPGEGGGLMLNVRIATPPPDHPDAPPGIVSSYLFGLHAGDEVKVLGPFGDLTVQDTEREMVFVGGGAGMPPMRALILDQLLGVGTNRTISYWYGARSLSEAFYEDLFERLEREHHNFRWHLALSEPRPEDDWSGDSGFIHQVLHDRYLKNHPTPEELEYYLCGPPQLIEATRQMLYDLGVEPDNIRYDSF